MKEPEILEDLLESSENLDKFNFKCPYCHKNLSSRQNLKEHVNIHTGNKPYQCDEPGCGKQFRQGSLLSIHKRIHIEIRKGLEIKKIHKFAVYPNLTTLISSTTHNVHFSLQGFEIKEWIDRIGLDQFSFLKTFIS
jgi:uncharacterized Zn-finger protein